MQYRTSTEDLIEQKKEAVKSNTGHLKLSSQRRTKKMKRSEESLWIMGYHQEKLCISGVPEGAERKGQKNCLKK